MHHRRGQMTSSWSISTNTSYLSVRLKGVKIWLERFVKRLVIKLIKLLGSLSLFRA